MTAGGRTRLRYQTEDLSQRVGDCLYLDDAIDVVRKITEKYTLLVIEERRQSLEELHRSGAPTVYPILVHMEKSIDLLQEMKRRKLPEGWESIFLEPWAKPEIISRPLGETKPPRSGSEN